MKTTGEKRRRRTGDSGFTMLELVVAALILGILAVGSLGYQYYATRSARQAEVEATASRLAKIVLDKWKGLEGATDYNPPVVFAASLTLSPSSIGPEPASAQGALFTTLGRYRVTINSDHYFITCSWREATADQPRVLNVAVAWRPDYGNNVLEDDAREVRYSAYAGYEHS